MNLTGRLTTMQSGTVGKVSVDSGICTLCTAAYVYSANSYMPYCDVPMWYNNCRPNKPAIFAGR